MVQEFPNLTVSANGTLPSVPFLALKERLLGKRYTLSIAFVSPKLAQSINLARRGKDYIPNTLSFSLGDSSGEIVMCRSTIRAQHREFGMTYEMYLTYLLIHSMLHLKGYEHGSTMEALEMRHLKHFFHLTN